MKLFHKGSSLVAALFLLYLGIVTAQDPFFLPNHPYIKPDNEPGQHFSSQRGPCPALNSLANHGYVNRNGSDISTTDLGQACERVYGFNAEECGPDLLQIAFDSGIPEGVSAVDGITPTFNLFDLYLHNILEHDGSLVRSDDYFQGPNAPYNQTLMDQFLVNATTDGTITYANAKAHRKNRFEHSIAFNPEVSWHHADETLFVIGVENFFLLMLGHNTDNDDAFEAFPESANTTLTLRTDFLESFLKDNKIPEEYRPRMERGLPFISPVGWPAADKIIKDAAAELTAVASVLQPNATEEEETQAGSTTDANGPSELENVEGQEGQVSLGTPLLSCYYHWRIWVGSFMLAASIAF